MRRSITVAWHLLSFLVVAALYFIFVMPRWWELLGTWPHGVGTAARIGTGLLLALTALPVVLTLNKTRKPEFGTPQLALTLRSWSIIGHVAAGALIVITAIAEIWLDLDSFGRGLFAVYGAAAAIALLGAAAFYLAYAAELPPPPPKPLKPKRERGRKSAVAPVEDSEDDADTGEADSEPDVDTDAEAEDTEADSGGSEDGAADDDAAGTETEETETAVEAAEETQDAKPTGKGLRNRRPRKQSGVSASDS